MPREEIDIPYRLDYLSILNERGEVDKELEPEIEEELLKKPQQETKKEVNRGLMGDQRQL